jgi:hypothetical protein
MDIRSVTGVGLGLPGRVKRVRGIALVIAFPVCLALALSGCATMRYPKAYKVEGTECVDFKELDDEKALKLIALIYNVKHQDAVDDIARSLALEQYMNLVKKRNSVYCRNSGIFDIKYDKVVLKKMGDEDLYKLYEDLEPRAGTYYMESAKELSEAQNTQRITYLTAICCVANEMRRREGTRQAMAVAGQVLAGALTVAMSFI